MEILKNPNKRKPKPKLNAKQRQDKLDWEAQQLKWKNIPKFSKTNVVLKGKTIATVKLPQVASLLKPKVIGWHPSAGFKPASFYTGNVITGIATMHKSNMVPITNRGDAIAVAHMRR